MAEIVDVIVDTLSGGDDEFKYLYLTSDSLGSGYEIVFGDLTYLNKSKLSALSWSIRKIAKSTQKY